MKKECNLAEKKVLNLAFLKDRTTVWKMVRYWAEMSALNLEVNLDWMAY
jgi:hypothetical protein